MRSKIALALAVLGLLLLGAGIGQRTIWLPPKTVTAAVTAPSTAAPLTVIEPAVLATKGGDFTLSIKAKGPIQLAVGRERDVAAWVDGAAHLDVTGVNADFTSLETKTSKGQQTVPNPAGSDLWVSEQKASGQLEYTWKAPGHGDWALLLASDGTAPAPADISLTAGNDAGTPWAVPLMVLGSIALVLAALLFFIRPRPRPVAGRRAAGRGPSAGSTAMGRDGDPAKGRTSVAPKDGGTLSRLRWGTGLVAVLAAGGLVAGGAPALAADSSSPPVPSGSSAPATVAPSSFSATVAPSSSATADAQAAFPVLLESQLERILAQVASTVTTGDNAKDTKKLQARVAGPALAMRAANYKIRSQVSSYAALPPVTSTELLARVVPTTAAWPRSLLAVTQGQKNQLPQLLTLVQQAPRENYKLLTATPLLPGQTFPSVPSEGTQAVALGYADGLAMNPRTAIASLSDVLSKKGSKWNARFKDNVYTKDVAAYQAQLQKDAKDASFVFSHKAGSVSYAFKTADGGALVVADYTFGVDAKAKAGAKLSIGAEAAVFAGGKETTKGFTLRFAEPVVMYIPPTGGDGKVTVLSATRSLVGASFK